MYQAIFFDFDIYKSIKIGDVIDDVWYYYVDFQVIDGMNIGEFEGFGGIMWIKAWFF